MLLLQPKPPRPRTRRWELAGSRCACSRARAQLGRWVRPRPAADFSLSRAHACVLACKHVLLAHPLVVIFGYVFYISIFTIGLPIPIPIHLCTSIILKVIGGSYKTP